MTVTPRWAQATHPRGIIESAELHEYHDGWRLIICRREVTAHPSKEDALAFLAEAEAAAAGYP